MMRIIHLERTFRKILPELHQRWLKAGVERREILHIQTDLGSVRLKLQPSGVQLEEQTPSTMEVYLPQTYLMQMLIGYRGASEILEEEGVKIPEAALPILEALFPPGYPYIWWSDRF